MLSSRLGTPFDAFVEGEVREGRYASPEDVLRAGLRLLQERDPRVKDLSDAIAEGEASGYIEVDDHEAFCSAVRARRTAGPQL